MGVFSDSRLSADEKFGKKLEQNPYHPFTKIGDATFELRTRYTRLYVAIVIATLSVALLAVCIGSGVYLQAYFPWILVMLLVSCGTAYAYKDLRVYTIDGITESYSFRIADSVVAQGPLRNIYVRLRKRYDSGRNYYYLIFNGYRVEKQVLTGTCRSIDGMRQVGQRLAEALKINYFDDANVSFHHNIRHRRRDGKSMSSSENFVQDLPSFR